MVPGRQRLPVRDAGVVPGRIRRRPGHAGGGGDIAQRRAPEIDAVWFVPNDPLAGDVHLPGAQPGSSTGIWPAPRPRSRRTEQPLRQAGLPPGRVQPVLRAGSWKSLMRIEAGQLDRAAGLVDELGRLRRAARLRRVGDGRRRATGHGERTDRTGRRPRSTPPRCRHTSRRITAFVDAGAQSK